MMNVTDYTPAGPERRRTVTARARRFDSRAQLLRAWWLVRECRALDWRGKLSEGWAARAARLDRAADYLHRRLMRA